MAKTISSRVELSPHLTISSDLTSNQRQTDEVKVNTNSSRLGEYPQLQLSATGMQVVHATNGRIRIKATDGSFSANVKTITQHLKQYKSVREVASNEQTLSMVVIFDENQLSLPQMLGILQQLNIQTSQNSPLSDPFAPWKSVDFWKEQTVSFIPLMTGLAVTGGLGVSGLAAIPLYMITADATRLVIDYLEPQITGSDAVKESAKAVIVTEESKPESAGNRITKTTIKSAKVTYSIVHEIPGRIRFHIPQIASDRAYAKRLERLLKVDPLVNNVRINGDAASLAIAYQSGKVATSHWVSLMELAMQTTPPTQPITTINQSADIAVEKLSPTSPTLAAAVSQPTQPTETEFSPSADQTLNISNFWVDMKPAALSYSLNFIANLPL
ncbi:HMA2 domain-containing protein [Anabaena sp. CCY 9910]|uniref:HMA2 domain-containing protein n=1 Tax=Anabaena sp. CCY 9910 TaxID=3103870 RepID=UPI0039E1113C